MNIFDQVRNNKNFTTQNSYRWFQTEVKKVAGGVSGQSIMSTQGAKFVSGIAPGTLYIFQYDPKYKDKLPVWDMFPLVLPFSMDSSSFTGLNMHYLPVMQRFGVFQQLIDLASMYQGTVNSDKLRIYSWQFLKSIAMSQQVGPCVHKYLKSHVRSRFLKIPPKDWLTSILLPVEHFIRK
jgi:hypothetical protein